MKPPRYWRSLEQVAGAPDYLERASREFPEGAVDAPAGITRRDMLVLLGASLSMAGLAGCRRPVEHIVPYVHPPEEIMPGVALHYATTMPFGLSAYGLVVESHEGRPTKIEGNEQHPTTLGSSTPFIQAAIYGLYDPDRSRTVLRAGAPATWDDFLTAWKKLLDEHGKDGGAGLAVLTGAFASPTLSRLRAALLERLPHARWATYEPVSPENVRAGVEAVTGRPYRPSYDVAGADVILSLDADFLGGDPEAIRHGRGFADRRRLSTPQDSMNRLYVVEGSVTATGACADHRLALPSGRIAAFTAALCRALAAQGLKVEVPAGAPAAADLGIEPAWLAGLAGDLVSHRGRGLILAGWDQPPEVHAAAIVLNAALGNVGGPVTFHDVRDSAAPSRSDLADLVEAMNGGSVQTLVVVGGNPVYDAPVDLDFGDALAKVGTTIHLGAYADETAARSTWHLPRAHFLESWGDARAVDGTLSVIQPLIAPLLGGHSDVELFHVLATGEEKPGYDLVRETWQPILGQARFETEWNRVLHDGLLAGSESTPAAPKITTAIPARLGADPGPFGGDELEIRFVPSPAVHDGRFANVAWLQELSDPATKLTWDNAATLSPATARRLGVSNGEVVRLTYRERSLEAPAFVLPGQADGTVSVALGYGRTAAGRVGNGVGFDAYRLRTSGAPGFGVGARVERAGRTHLLATTQDHWVVDELGIEERARRLPTLLRHATLAEYRRDPKIVESVEPEHPPLESLWKERGYDEGYQWGMSIDLNACVGCNACVIACQSENNIPAVGKRQVSRGREMQWIRIDRYFTGSPDLPEQILFMPVTCMQCENAPCEEVCPVGATVHDREGLNVMVYNRCIGTRYCSNNCPYKVRRFNFFNYTKDTPELLQMAYNPDVTVRARGVMEKCTYCVQRLNRAKLDAKLTGGTVRDGDVQTACQQACPTRAIEFGNVIDPDSRVATLKRQPRSYAMLEELNNKPRTSYLARIRNPNPEIEEA